MFIEKSLKRGEAVPERIVILRALQLGDLLCAVPAYRALRTALPHAQITLVGLPWSRQFVQRFNQYLDHFVEFPGFPGFPERTPQIERFPGFLSEIQQMDFDLAIQMQGSGWLANSLVVLFGAVSTAGFYVPGEYCPDENHFLRYPSDVHEVKRHLKLMEFLGFPSQGQHLEYPLYPRDWQEFHVLEEKYGLRSGEYICVHPGGRAANRRWPPERFIAIADMLASRGHQIVLTGTEVEKPLTTVLQNSMRFSAINLAGETTLGSIAALISKSRFLICNDTGVSHIAAALRKPSIVLVSNSELNRWAPLDRSLHRAIELTQPSSAELLFQAIEELLREAPAYAD